MVNPSATNNGLNASGAQNHRCFVGPAGTFDVMSALQFVRLFQAGLRGDSNLLEVGCGSLRAARILIPFLEPDRYFGLEPDGGLVEQGLDRELGRDILAIKRPRFAHNSEFDLSALRLPAQGVDFAIAQSIFSHTSLAQFGAGVRAVGSALAPDGVFIATFVRGSHDYAGSSWVYPGCVTFRDETVRSIASASGLSVRITDWVHPNDQTWVLFARSPGRLDAIPEDDRFSAAEYVRTIAELRRRIESAKRFPPVRLVMWLRDALQHHP